MEFIVKGTAEFQGFVEVRYRQVSDEREEALKFARSNAVEWHKDNDLCNEYPETCVNAHWIPSRLLQFNESFEDPFNQSPVFDNMALYLQAIEALNTLDVLLLALKNEFIHEQIKLSRQDYYIVFDKREPWLP